MAPAALQVPVTLVRGPSPSTPDELPSPHALVDWRGSELRLAVEGLRSAATSWNAEQGGAPVGVDALLQRAVLHGLVHVADRRAGWSRTARWRQLSGWGLLGGPAAERAAGAFASTEARVSAGEDLASTVTAVLDAAARPPSNSEQDPRCRLPSKVAFVVDVLGGFEERPCPRSAEVGLDSAGVGAIELAYAAGSTGSIASVAGHLFVVVSSQPGPGESVRQDSYALVGTAEGPMTVRTALSGLVGTMPSAISRRPFELVLQHYAHDDNRDVRRYALRLDAAQKERLLRRLDELLQGWDRSYAFLTRNCTALGVELVRAALEGNFHPPTPLSPETFLGMLDRRGLLQPVRTDRTDAIGIGSRALAADRLRARAARTLTHEEPTLGAPLREALASGEARRAEAYAGLAHRTSGRLDTLLALDQFLSWSDAVEQAAAAEAEQQGEASEDLRAAKAAVRAEALALGADYGSFRSGEAELLATAAPPRDSMGSHSTLSGYGVWGEVGADLVGWVGVRSALFDSRVGEPRRYSPGTNSGYTLLASSVAVSTEGRIRLAGELAGIRTLEPSRGPFSTGFYGQLAVTERWEPVSGQLDMRWFEAGGLLALWRGQEGGLLAWLSGGLALDTRGAADTPLLEGVGVEAPVGLLVRADSPDEALTGLTLSLRWAPRLSGAGLVTARSTASAEGRVRLGEAFGSAFGLTLNGTLVGEDLRHPTAMTPAVQLGLRVERF